MLQVIEQNDEEKRKMYNKCSKKELITMLIEANKQLNKIQPKVMSFNNNFNEYKPIIGKVNDTEI